MDVRTETFRSFLVRAKQQTYAGDGPKAEPSRPQSVDLHYVEGDLLYIDTYLGSLDFIGEEAVWAGGQPVWGMNYFGRMLTDRVPDGFSQCLKGALQAVPPEAPYRGPAQYNLGDLEYRCSWEGDLADFRGVEDISQSGRVIYRLRFHGGLIR